MSCLVNQPGQIFVGRQRELAQLQAAMDEAMAGRGQVIMLAGEPGIGKTRLAQELATHAESLGAQVMWGSCYEHVGAPPYWPYVQPIRTYAEAVDTQTLSSQLGLGGPVIAEIVPELRAKLPDLGQPNPAEPDQARFRLFDSVSTFLKNVSKSQPLLFVVDDLHWADSSSLLMLEFLVREITASPVFVLGTYRDVEVTGSHPLSKTLGNLVRERHFRRVQLDGFTWQEVGEFVEGHKGVNLSSDILEMIHNRTEGNPLFVNEVVELIDTEQMTENQAWANIIPEGVRDAIGSRLSRLSSSCNQVLGIASVIGREFEFSLLKSLDIDMGADGVLAALDEAVEAKVIEELPGSVGRYQFGHALIQQTLHGELSSARRLRAHASIGEALEQIHGSNLAEHAEELANHFSEAQTLIGTEKLVRYSLLAGERSLAAYANEEALAHYQLVLSAKDDQEVDAETASMLFGLGRAQMAALGRERILEAVGNLDRAFDYYARTGDVARAVAVAEHPIPPLTGYSTGTGQRIARVLTMVRQDSLQAGRLLALHGRILGQEIGDYEGASDAFGRALAIAKRENDTALEFRTLAGASYVNFHHCRWRECLENGPRAIELARTVDDLHGELLTRWSVAVAEIATGHLDAARRHVAAGMTVAEKLRDSFWLSGSLLRSEFVSRSEGDWRMARDTTDRGLALSPLETRLLSVRVLSEYQVGDFEEGEAYLERFLDALSLAPPGPTLENGMAAALIPLTERISGAAYRSEIAESAAQAVMSSALVTPLVAAFTRTGLALLAVGRGDLTASQEQYAALKSLQGTVVPQILISVDRLLGLLAQTMANPDQAAAHFEDAVAFCRNAGYRPELAWTCSDYAECLLGARGSLGEPSGRFKVTALLDEGMAIATELGMLPLAERIAALRDLSQTKPGRAPNYPDGLSEREVEVLRLLATGKTNREIGEILIISIKTASNHVSSILSKTGAANRTEAANYATQRHLI